MSLHTFWCWSQMGLFLLLSWSSYETQSYAWPSLSPASYWYSSESGSLLGTVGLQCRWMVAGNLYGFYHQYDCSWALPDSSMFDCFSMNCRCLDSRICQLYKYRFLLLYDRWEVGPEIDSKTMPFPSNQQNISLDNIHQDECLDWYNNSVNSQLDTSFGKSNEPSYSTSTFVFLILREFRLMTFQSISRDDIPADVGNTTIAWAGSRDDIPADVGNTTIAWFYVHFALH